MTDATRHMTQNQLTGTRAGPYKQAPAKIWPVGPVNSKLVHLETLILPKSDKNVLLVNFTKLWFIIY